MREDTASLVKQVATDCEAQHMIREAECLDEITRVCYEIDANDAGTEPVPPDSSEEDEGNNESDSLTIDLCAALVQNVARALVEEARSLQSGMERYAAQLLVCTDLDAGESSSKLENSAAQGNDYGVIQEALAIVNEAERLQELVMRLRASVVETADGDQSDDD